MDALPAASFVSFTTRRKISVDSLLFMSLLTLSCLVSVSYLPPLSVCLLPSGSSARCSRLSGAGSPVAKWPAAPHARWYNNASPCTGLLFHSSRTVRGLCLSFSETAAHAYLPFYFEAWLTCRQPWHSCRRCGACYYAYINILINTWSAIEEIITCHHSTVWKERALLSAYARTRIHLQVSSQKYYLCTCRSSPSINDHCVTHAERLDSLELFYRDWR